MFVLFLPIAAALIIHSAPAPNLSKQGIINAIEQAQPLDPAKLND